MRLAARMVTNRRGKPETPHLPRAPVVGAKSSYGVRRTLFGVHVNRLNWLRVLREQIEKEFPTSWLDPLLTGPDTVIGQPPYEYLDIERLLLAVKARVLAVLAASAPQPKQENKS